MIIQNRSGCVSSKVAVEVGGGRAIPRRLVGDAVDLLGHVATGGGGAVFFRVQERPSPYHQMPFGLDTLESGGLVVVI